MHVLKWAVTATLMLAVAGCASKDEGYISPYGPGTPTALPNSPGRGVWNPPAVTSAMLSGSSNVTLYGYIPSFPVESRPAQASLTPELPTTSERKKQENALIDAGNNQKKRMENRLERDGR